MARRVAAWFISEAHSGVGLLIRSSSFSSSSSSIMPSSCLEINVVDQPWWNLNILESRSVPQTMASTSSSSGESGGDPGFSIIPQSNRNDVYGVSGLSSSDRNILRNCLKRMARMTNKSFKIVSAISGVDLQFAAEFLNGGPESDDDDSSVASDRSHNDHALVLLENDNPAEPEVGERDIIFYGPDNIPRNIRETTITRIREIELWLYGGALNNINAIVIKPKGVRKLFTLTAGRGASVDRSCLVELMTPLCGDPVGEMTVKPRKAGFGITKNRKGQCFARLLVFDDGLGL